MKLFNLVLALTFSAVMAMPAQAQYGPDGLPNVAGITDVIVSDVTSYVAALKAGSEAFRTLGANSAFFCQAVSGGVPGEGYVLSVADNLEASLASVEVQLSDPGFQDFVATLAPYRELTGTRTARVLRPPSGSPSDTWATREFYVRTDDIPGYMAMLEELERAARSNGLQDFSIIVQQEIASGDTSEMLLVTASSSTLAAVGAVGDALMTESWALEIAMAAQAQRQLLRDRFYKCESVYRAS